MFPTFLVAWTAGSSAEPLLLPLLLVFLLAAGIVLLRSYASPSIPSGLQPLSSLPSPAGALPLLGHFLLMQPGTKLHLKFIEWANSLGGMFRLQLFNKTILVLSDIKLIMPILGAGADALPKESAMYTIFLDVSSSLDGKQADSVFTATHFQTKAVKAVRKELSTAFAMGSMRKVVAPVATAKAQQLVKTCLDAVELSSTPGQPASLGLTPFLSRMNLEIALITLFKLDLDKFDTGPFFKSLELSLEELSLRILDPTRKIVQKALPFLSHSRFVSTHLTVCHKVWQKVYDQIMEGAPYGEDDTSLSAGIWRLKDVHGMSHEELISNIAVMVVAGFDTSTHTTAWVLYDIASNPHIQRDLVAELKAAGLLKTGADASTARQVEWEDLWALPLLNAVLKESMRLHSIAPMGSIRAADRPVAIGGYHVPQGTIVWVPFAPLTRSHRNWADPLAFKPERWLQADAAAATAAAADAPASEAAVASLPFSVGPRNCLGQNMANVVLRVVLLELLTCLWFDVAPSMGSVADVKDNEVFNLVLRVTGGVQLTARKH